MVNYEIELKQNEKIQALLDIKKQCLKGLYVYEQSQISDRYNYKDFIYNLSIFVQSTDDLFDGELSKIVINLYSILKNDFDKKEYKRIILECKNFLEYRINLCEVGDTNGQSN